MLVPKVSLAAPRHFSTIEESNFILRDEDPVHKLWKSFQRAPLVWMKECESGLSGHPTLVRPHADVEKISQVHPVRAPGDVSTSSDERQRAGLDVLDRAQCVLH